MTNGTASETNGITCGTNGDGLLSCPFCGGEAEIDRYTIKPYVSCSKCGCSMPDRHQTAEQAIEAWNTRAAVTDHDFAIAVHDGRAWVCVEGMSPEEIEAAREGRFMAVTPQRFADACQLIDERDEEIRRQQARIAELERERGKWQFKFCKEVGLHVSDVFMRDELIREMYESLWDLGGKWAQSAFAERMRELEIEVKP